MPFTSANDLNQITEPLDTGPALNNRRNPAVICIAVSRNKRVPSSKRVRSHKRRKYFNRLDVGLVLDSRPLDQCI
jgi:hypothetical protein